jgi:hypothetical protein
LGAPTFDQARVAFEKAWRVFLSNGPKRIFRHGAIIEIGPPRNIAASIEVATWPVIGTLSVFQRSGFRFA